MAIPTEPIGSIPRPLALIEAVAAAGDGADPELDPRRLFTFQGAIGTTGEALRTQACPRTGPAAEPTP